MKKWGFRILFALSFTLVLVTIVSFAYFWKDTNQAYENFSADVIVGKEMTSTEITIIQSVFPKSDEFIELTADRLANMYLESNSTNHSNYSIKRFLLAKRLQANFSVSELTTTYLSLVYVGNGEYGIASASQSVFQKSIDNLNEDEAKTLALFIRIPSCRDLNEQCLQLKSKATNQ